MKKVVAILVVCMIFMMSSAAFAADKPTTATSTGEKSQVRTFFSDAQNLFMDQIPNTPKSATYDRLWDPAEKQSK